MRQQSFRAPGPIRGNAIHRRSNTSASTPGAVSRVMRASKSLKSRLLNAVPIRLNSGTAGTRKPHTVEQSNVVELPIGAPAERLQNEMLDKFDRAARKVHDACKTSAGSGSGVGSSVNNRIGIEQQTSDNTSSNEDQSPPAVASGSDAEEKAKQQKHGKVADWLNDNEDSLLAPGCLPPVVVEASRKLSRGVRRAGSSAKHWMKTSFSSIGSSSSIQNLAPEPSNRSAGGAQRTKLDPHPTKNITEVLLEQKKDFLEAAHMTKGRVRVVQRQVEFLRSQLEAIQKTTNGDLTFMQSVDTLDNLILAYQKLQHKLEELEDEREILKRKVLSSRAAAEALRAQKPAGHNLPGSTHEMDKRVFVKLAYAGLLKEHE